MGLFDKLKASMQKKAEDKRKEEEEREAARQAAENQQKENEKLELKNYFLKHFDDYPDDYFDKWDRFLSISTDEEIEELEERQKEKKRNAINQAIEDYLAKATEEVNCDIGKGDCCWLGDKFYCTCGSETDCPRKKYVKEMQNDCLLSTAHLPYIKALSTYKKVQDFFDREKWSYRSNDENLKVGILDVFKHFFKTFFPEYGQGWFDEIILEYFMENGFGKQNALLDIMTAYQSKTDGKEMPYFHTLVEFKHVDLHQDFFKNPSLYDRSFQDFTYTVKILNAASDIMKAVDTFKQPDKVNVEALFNEDGTIKAAGYGGPKAGFYGDEIYNIVSTWNEEE